MTETNSPLSPYIIATPLDDPSDREIALKTQPFFSLFYETTSKMDDAVKKQMIQNAARTREKNLTVDDRFSCKTVFEKTVPSYFSLTENIPFTPNNILFLLVVFLTTVIMGVVTCLYYMFLMEDDADVLRTKTTVMSVFFLLMVACLSITMYEFFTLKLSLIWFDNYRKGEPTPFYQLVLNTRKIFLWIFVLLWLVAVIYATVVVSKRTQKFRELVVVNVVSCLVLLVAQYAYYKTSYREVKVFCVGVSVGVISLILYLLYGL